MSTTDDGDLELMVVKNRNGDGSDSENEIYSSETISAGGISHDSNFEKELKSIQY